MSYELLALPVPPGAEIEEAGEALEVRLAGGHVFVDRSEAAAARRRDLATAARVADPSLAAVDEGAAGGRVVLSGAAGVTLEIDSTFVVFRVPYALQAEDVEEIDSTFERLFAVVDAVVRETGWQVYDPQDAAAVGVGDSGRDATLEIYLTVLDQLLPGKRLRPR